MEDNYTSKIIIVFFMIISLVTYGLFKQYNTSDTQVTSICKEDSLREVINDLHATLEIEEEGWDKKESRYEDIIFEYEYGINHLKNSHPQAYREFHRIIGFKEKYERTNERENKKRLNINKW